LSGDGREFLDRVRARLEVGQREYADRSYRRPPLELLEEIQEELEDVAAWSSILWEVLERVRPHLPPGAP
jgi:hypothetical protein